MKRRSFFQLIAWAFVPMATPKGVPPGVMLPMGLCAADLERAKHVLECGSMPSEDPFVMVKHKIGGTRPHGHYPHEV